MVFLAATMAPRFTRDNIQEAADQVVSHLRYTKHLAMVDEKFKSSDSGWFKKRWQLKFSQSTDGKNMWTYAIFSDTNLDGNVSYGDTIAKNPMDPNRYLLGYTDDTNLKDYVTKELNIGDKFGIEDINFTNCGSTDTRIAFDYLGRPIVGDISYSTRLYEKSRILRQKCNISICTVNPCSSASSSEKITIVIEPMTGYIHIL